MNAQTIYSDCEMCGQQAVRFNEWRNVPACDSCGQIFFAVPADGRAPAAIQPPALEIINIDNHPKAGSPCVSPEQPNETSEHPAPCIFCGSRHTALQQSGSGFHVECLKCHARGNSSRDKAKALSRWQVWFEEMRDNDEPLEESPLAECLSNIWRTVALAPAIDAEWQFRREVAPLLRRLLTDELFVIESAVGNLRGIFNHGAARSAYEMACRDVLAVIADRTVSINRKGGDD